MNNPKVTVITICYNAVNEIEKTICSVISQTYKDVEYIIIDGGSSDGTVGVLKKYQDKISKWISEPDNGIYDAINKGIKMASGEWINCMNAGDVFHDKFVLENIFCTHIPNNVSVLYSNHIKIKQTGLKVLGINDMNSHVWGFNHQSVIYKRCLHKQYGYYLNDKKKLLISDTLFFAPIPDEEKMKVDYIIADYAEGGASGLVAMDIYKQNLCAEYIYKKVSFESIVFTYYKRRLKMMIPENIRCLIRLLLKRGV